MKHFLTLALSLALLFTITFSAKASHMVGAEISYTCTATPGIWQVTLIIYRDCQGIPLCSGSCSASGCTQTLAIKGADPTCNGTSYGTATLNFVSVSDVNINPQCPNSKSICTNMGCVTPGTFIPGIEKYVFQGNVNLGTGSGIPATCCNVRLSWEQCCRNSAISTLIPNNFYTEAVMNRCLSLTPCNSSPQLLNDPFAVICGGQPYVFNSGASDPDHDSLSYAFAPALEGPGVSASYRAPYSFQTPMPYYGNATDPFPFGIKCDSVGNIKFTPSCGACVSFVGVVAVMIKQWKTIAGVPTLMGTTTRDNQMWLSSCPPNNPPGLQTFPASQTIGTSTNTYYNLPRMAFKAYKGIPLCFDVIAKDTDFTPTYSDTTYLSWDNSLAAMGATFTKNYVDSLRKTNGPREDYFKFCWTPPANAVSSYPYYFTFTAKDSRCPNPGRITLAASILVSDSPMIAISKTQQSCYKWNLSFSNTVPSYISNFAWELSNTKGAFNLSSFTSFTTQTVSNLYFSDTGKYVVRLKVNPGASNSVVLYDTIVQSYLRPQFTSLIRDTALCINNSLTFKTSVISGKGPFAYSWSKLSPVSILSTSDSLYLPDTVSGVFNYRISVTDTNGCNINDTFKVTVNKLPTLTLVGNGRICAGSSITLDGGNNTNNVKKYLWSTGDTTRTIIRNDSNSFTLTLTDTNNCAAIAITKLYVNQPVIANAGNDTTVCASSLITLRASGGQLYQWKNLTTNTIITSKTATATVNVTPTANTSYEVTVYATQSAVECSKKDTIQVTVNALPVLTRPAAVEVCRNNGTAILATFTSSQPGGTYAWTYAAAPGAIITNTSVKIDSLKNLPPLTTLTSADNWIRYAYTALQSFGGCTAKDSAIVRVYSNPQTDAGLSKSYCNNDANVILNTAQTATPAGGIWSGSSVTLSGSNYIFNPSTALLFPAINVLNYAYSKVYTTITTCSKTDTVGFSVYPKPATDAGSVRSFCNNDADFILNAAQNATPVGGTWSGSNVSTSGGNYVFKPSTAALYPAIHVLNYVYYKTYSLSLTCTASDTVAFTVFPKPVTSAITGSASPVQNLSSSYNVTNTSGSNYNWSATNGNIAAGQGSNIVSVLFTSTGVAQLSVIETRNGCRDTASKSVTVLPATGINNLNASFNVNIYPNPANTELNIELGDVSEETAIEMIDVLGKLVLQKAFHAKNNFSEKLDVSGLARGVYFITIKVGEQQMQSKVVLK